GLVVATVQFECRCAADLHRDAVWRECRDECIAELCIHKTTLRKPHQDAFDLSRRRRVGRGRDLQHLAPPAPCRRQDADRRGEKSASSHGRFTQSYNSRSVLSFAVRARTRSSASFWCEIAPPNPLWRMRPLSAMPWNWMEDRQTRFFVATSVRLASTV